MNLNKWLAQVDEQYDRAKRVALSITGLSRRLTHPIDPSLIVKHVRHRLVQVEIDQATLEWAIKLAEIDVGLRPEEILIGTWSWSRPERG